MSKIQHLGLNKKLKIELSLIDNGLVVATSKWNAQTVVQLKKSRPPPLDIDRMRQETRSPGPATP